MNGLSGDIVSKDDTLEETEEIAQYGLRPFVAEIYQDCGKIKDGILLNLWKLSA